jgi:hypothetical protein
MSSTFPFTADLEPLSLARSGHTETFALQKSFIFLGIAHFHICGPPAMVKRNRDDVCVDSITQKSRFETVNSSAKYLSAAIIRKLSCAYQLIYFANYLIETQVRALEAEVSAYICSRPSLGVSSLAEFCSRARSTHRGVT